MLLIIAAVVALIARRLKLPYTVGLAAAGAALAAAHIGTGAVLTRDLIFNGLLPPLLFEAAINIHWRELKRDALPVLVLATLGVVISAVVVAAGMTLFAGWPAPAAIVFGILIAATDPVSVIAMFKESGVTGRLRLLVESESLLNDGVAAVFFSVAVSFAAGFHGVTVGGVSLALAGTVFGGVAVGAAAAGIAFLLAWRASDHLVETTLTAAAAYGSFLAADHLHVSGVLATVTAGLVMGNIGLLKDNERLISGRGREAVLTLWDFAAFVANSLIFLLIGSRAAHIPFHSLGLYALLISITLVLAGRALSVYPLCALFMRSRYAIEPRQQHVLFWGGLRGALGLALALSLPQSMVYRDQVVIATFGVVVFSIVAQGITMPALLRCLGLLEGTAGR